MAEGKKLIRLALFGEPVKSSLSPVIHRAFADQFGLDIDYSPIETGPDDFPASLQAFRESGGAGCNITLPLKREAWQLASGETEQVRLAQAANTLVYQPDLGWFAHNTDGPGLVTDMTVNHGLPVENRRLLILGAGGATAGILGSLLGQNPAGVVLVNRNLERAGALAGRFAGLGNIAVHSWTDLNDLGRFDLVINATSLGHSGRAPALVATLFSDVSCCYDLNYYKAGEPLAALCGELGVRYVDGLGMLVEQAAHSFAIWTGKQPESTSVINSMRSMVKGRA
jgi:shikimate dehydrogenase